ncbi:chlorophyll synthase ChlG [Lichenibacterium dinghuense]|uniref:chlorophyll synthase ChlG n=1 Tax=Lichenibacterium dinghuense TaxID=2895977 RepID=UPI001F4231D2|nr:chlorophyll synthase ChlG [Lichenibacterium sp. 6Y81]
MRDHSVLAPAAVDRPTPAAVLELLKPITWFPPMWAFGCGLVSGGLTLPSQIGLMLGGVVLAGPLLCGASQAVNDWFDRHVDAVNEPNRPIPSGRVPGHWGLAIAVVASALSLAVAAAFGRWVLVPAALGTALSWAYSAPPLRLKANGWLGNAAVALSYEGLAWLAGAAVVAGTAPDGRVLALALLYSLGAHGIMTLNDFKSVEGDRRMGVRSLPVQLGVRNAARVACAAMALPQVAVALLLLEWGRAPYALAIAALTAAQLALMPRFLRDPRGEAPRYNASGTGLSVLGMLVAAFAVRGLVIG